MKGGLSAGFFQRMNHSPTGHTFVKLLVQLHAKTVLNLVTLLSLVVKYAPVKFANFLHSNYARTRLTTLPHSGSTKVRLFPAVLINLHNSKVCQIGKFSIKYHISRPRFQTSPKANRRSNPAQLTMVSPAEL